MEISEEYVLEPIRKLLYEYEKVLREPTYTISEYWKWIMYESDPNHEKIEIEVDNKSVNIILKIFGYFLTTGVRIFYKSNLLLDIKLSSQF